jgi:ribonuclease BN (tRNA processing enzyme)
MGENSALRFLLLYLQLYDFLFICLKHKHHDGCSLLPKHVAFSFVLLKKSVLYSRTVLLLHNLTCSTPHLNEHTHTHIQLLDSIRRLVASLPLYHVAGTTKIKRSPHNPLMNAETNKRKSLDMIKPDTQIQRIRTSLQNTRTLTAMPHRVSAQDQETYDKPWEVVASSARERARRITAALSNDGWRNQQDATKSWELNSVRSTVADLTKRLRPRDLIAPTHP